MGMSISMSVRRWVCVCGWMFLLYGCGEDTALLGESTSELSSSHSKHLSYSYVVYIQKSVGYCHGFVYFPGVVATSSNCLQDEGKSKEYALHFSGSNEPVMGRAIGGVKEKQVEQDSKNPDLLTWRFVAHKTSEWRGEGDLGRVEAGTYTYGVDYQEILYDPTVHKDLLVWGKAPIFKSHFAKAPQSTEVFTHKVANLIFSQHYDLSYPTTSEGGGLEKFFPLAKPKKNMTKEARLSYVTQLIFHVMRVFDPRTPNKKDGAALSQQAFPKAKVVLRQKDSSRDLSSDAVRSYNVTLYRAYCKDMSSGCEYSGADGLEGGSYIEEALMDEDVYVQTRYGSEPLAKAEYLSELYGHKEAAMRLNSMVGRITDMGDQSVLCAGDEGAVVVHPPKRHTYIPWKKSFEEHEYVVGYVRDIFVDPSMNSSLGTSSSSSKKRQKCGKHFLLQHIRAGAQRVHEHAYKYTLQFHPHYKHFSQIVGASFDAVEEAVHKHPRLQAYYGPLHDGL